MRKASVALVLLLVLFACETLDRPELEGPPISDRALVGLTPGPPFLEMKIPVPSGQDMALVPPITTFIWQTIDGVGDPDSAQWILVSTVPFDNDWNATLDYIRGNPDAPEWHPWQAYDPSNNVGTSWTTPPLDFGQYVFAVHGRAMDETASPDFNFSRNAVRVLVSRRTTGPLLRLTSDFHDPVISATTGTPVTLVELPAGTPVDFCWTGDASSYGGVVTAYRYGWDILDLADDTQWQVGWTASDGSETCTTRIFFFGTHTFYVEVVDNNGFPTRIPVRINYTPPPVVLSLDIQPDACPSGVNPWGKGALSPILLGSEGFDVTDVDLSTLALNESGFTRQDARPGQIRIEDVSTAPTTPTGSPDCVCPEYGPDGFADLRLKFSLAEIARIVGPARMGDRVQLVLAGLLKDGTPFMAADCVEIVGLELPEEPPPEGPDTEIFRVINTYYVDGQRVDEFIDTEDAVPDTVPFRSWVNVFYNGSPGPSDTSFCTDVYNKCITYQKSLTWHSSRFPGLGSTTPWLPETGEDNNPFGTLDSTSLSMGTVEYNVQFRAVDEFGVGDPTPAEVPIVANFPPTLEDFGIEHYDGTLIGDGGSVAWDWWNPANYHGSILDTLDISDPTNLRVIKKFYFLIKGVGRDHPKEASTGGVKSWFYTFKRSDDPSVDQPFARSGVWADVATVNSVCDTVSLTVRYTFFDPAAEQEAFANLPDWVNRSYDFAIRGRDTRSTDEFDQLIYVNGTRTLINRYAIGMLGRETGEGRMTFYLGVVR